MIAVVNSGIANIGSVLNAFRRIGAPVSVTTDAAGVHAASALVLPGVGAFADGMDSLRRHGLVQPIRDAAARGTPILGICLGMQLLADQSEEFGRHEGLGLIHGRVVRLEPNGPGQRVPNIGWCDMTIAPKARLFQQLGASSSFYFVHSYHLVCADPADVVATLAFGSATLTAAVERGNVFGAQFHPEKSQDAGLSLLASFARRVNRR